jgi:hypothetical protein
MLTLRKEHYEAFRETAREEFVRRMLTHLRDTFPKQTEPISKADLEAFVKRHRERAEAYNITLADDVEYYIDCAMKYGEHFDTDKKTNWAGQILRTPSLKGSEKVEYLKKFAAEREKKNG